MAKQTKKYQDQYWVTITLNRHSGNVQHSFRNVDDERAFYAKYPRNGKLEKIVIGCADWVEGQHVEVNYEYNVRRHSGYVVRTSGSMSPPRIDSRKYIVTRLSRSQAEKIYPALFERPNADLLRQAIRYEEARQSPVICNPELWPGYTPLPPEFVKQAKQIVAGK